MVGWYALSDLFLQAYCQKVKFENNDFPLVIPHFYLQAAHYKTNHILTLMGEDFTYKTGSPWFENMDKLIHYINEDGRVNIMYSTPAIYTRAGAITLVVPSLI